MSKLTAEVKDGNLIVTIPLNKPASPSATGKTMVHASSHGNQPTEVKIDGQPLIIGLNAYTKR